MQGLCCQDIKPLVIKQDNQNVVGRRQLFIKAGWALTSWAGWAQEDLCQGVLTWKTVGQSALLNWQPTQATGDTQKSLCLDF